MKSMQCVFVENRGAKGSKEAKIAVMKQIEEACEQAEKGVRAPVMIFPEGCSTNGKYVIDFKRGAFQGLRPVKPICYKYWSLRGIINDGSGMNVWWYSILLFHCIATGVILNELPVFAPNEYFWENHWDGKEDKWKLYANTIRKIIAEVGGLELHDATMEGKMELKKWLKNKPIKK